MNLGTKLLDIVGGSLFKEIKEGVMSYFPPGMTPAEKANAELKLQSFLHEKQLQTNKTLTEAASQLDKRIAEQEGKAEDLKAIPVLGNIIIFLRGVQRPVWGFATLIMDYKWFFETNGLTEQQQTAMMIINILVLGFLFGERAIRNLEPLITKVFAK